MNIQPSTSPTASLELRLTPKGHLVLEHEQAGSPEDRLLAEAFALGAGHGLLHLGASKPMRSLPPAFAWVECFRGPLCDGAVSSCDRWA